jgi:hypothetical protein
MIYVCYVKLYAISIFERSSDVARANSEIYPVSLRMILAA